MKRITIVEDNPDNRLLVCALLQEDYELFEYEDGLSALSSLATDRPDLILLDISLPNLDGSAVLQEIRKTDFRMIPVVALTAHAMEGDREKFMSQGFDGYISKPIVEEDELFSVIANLI